MPARGASICNPRGWSQAECEYLLISALMRYRKKNTEGDGLTMRLQTSLYTLFFLFSGNVLADNEVPLSDESDRINYTIGHQIGTDFLRQQVEFSEGALRQGLQHGRAGDSPALDRAKMEEMLLDLKRNITSKMKQDAIAKAEMAKAEEKRIRDLGAAFRKQFQAKEGVKTMPSGLEYRVIKPGNGPKPGLQDYVTIEYEARTVEGFVYDSSEKKGGPVTYRADSVIPGFTEAIQMMQPGANWELVMPPELAYGRQGPFAHHTVILDLELLSVSKIPPQSKSTERAVEAEGK